MIPEAYTYDFRHKGVIDVPARKPLLSWTKSRLVEARALARGGFAWSFYIIKNQILGLLRGNDGAGGDLDSTSLLWVIGEGGKSCDELSCVTLPTR